MSENGRQSPLYILDVYAIVYRSYFAFLSRPLRNPSGQNVSAVYGFFKFLFSLFEQRRPEAFAAVFDSKGKTFRHEMYDAYKATRQKTPEDLIAQVPVVEEILTALGVPMLRREGYEADDVIATLARRCRAEGRECYVISGDKDLLQLVGGSVRALRPQEGFVFRELGPAEVVEEWGVTPERILDYLSLTGDASDNVPGVRGIGDKTALKLLGQFKTLEDIYASLDEVKPDSLKAKLEAGRDDAALSRKLITLADGIDLGMASLDELCLARLDKAAAAPLFMREGMRSLAVGGAAAAAQPAPPQAGTARAPKPAPSAGPGLFDESGDESGGASAPATPPAAAPASAISAASTAAPESERQPAVETAYACINTEESLASLVDACIAAGAAAFDTETDSLDSLSAHIVGFSLSKAAGESFYVPIISPNAAALPIEAAQRQLGRLFSSEALIVGHNLKYDLHVMRGIGLAVRNKLFDTMVAAWILDAESNSFSLESLSERILGLSGITFESIVEKGNTFDSVPIETATRYAAEDADFTFRLYLYLKDELARQGLDGIFRDLEMPLVPVLAGMEEKGIVVNSGELRAYGVELEAALADIEKQA
ncbi:DNA polymerase I, partial [bacterium]|nr:DNA polymerase I [bacterium]